MFFSFLIIMLLRINYFITSYLLFCHCGVFALKAPIYCFYIIMLHLLYTGGIMFSEPIYCFENKFFPLRALRTFTFYIPKRCR